MTTRTAPTTTRRRTVKAPQDRVPRQTVSEVVDGPIEPLRFSSTAEQAPARMVHLFSIDDTDYHVPAEPRANLTLQFMARYREDPIDAQGWLFETLLGPEAHAALSAYDGLTGSDLRQLTAAVVKLVMGTAEEATGPLGRR
jgi:hypothetical protein